MSISISSDPAGYADAIARVTQLQDQIASMRTAFTGASATTGGAAVSGSATASAAGSADSTFATQLQSAMGDGQGSSATALGATDSTAASLVDSGLSSSGLTGLDSLTGLSTTGVNGGAALSSATLPANASTMLTSDQQQFASRLASDTGLDPGVVSAWLLAEENGSAATGRQSQDNNDWLNIGYTDGGTYGSSDSIWSDPSTAADATAGWLKGQDTIPGYGTASPGIQSIAATAGQAPAAQISALQSSGWASSGYPDLSSLYGEVTQGG